MPSVGPSLPPHLAKRKRDEDDDASAPDISPVRCSSPESSEKRRRVLGPAAPSQEPGRDRLPPSIRTGHEPSSSDDDVGPAPSKATSSVRVIGPTGPPAPLSERPPVQPSDDSDSSDDDFGPAPPPIGATSTADDGNEQSTGKSAFDTDPQFVEAPKKLQRDEWMTMPPTQDDLASRMDPSKMRARKFNSGKGAKPTTGGDLGIWTETPEQKLKRLQNEALGVAAPANTGESTRESRRNREEAEKARKIREKVDGSRGKSLVEQHKEKSASKEKEDDPSKRAFDYEKDVGSSMKISNKQRNEMLRKAKGFGDRFSSGSYL